MKTTSRGRWILMATAALMICASQAAGADDSYYGPALLQVQFDRLIPMSFPTASPKYDRMRQTTWPLIDPGVATVPTTENLVYPLDQPLLIMTEGVGQVTQAKPAVPPVVQKASEMSQAPTQSSGKPR